MAGATTTMSQTPIPDSGVLSRLIDRTLRCELFDCAATACTHPYSTGWRTAPFMVCAQAVGVDSRIEFSERPALLLRDGEAFIIPAGVPHCITMLAPVTAMSYWSHMQFTVFSCVDLLEIIAPPTILSAAPAARLGALNRELSRLKPLTSLAATVQRRILALQLLAIIIDTTSPSPHRLARLFEIQRVAPALQLIDRQLQDPELGITSLCAVSRLSASRFRTLFRAAVGMSPLDYLQARRMRRAEQLLLGGDERVKAVAALSGWNDQFHFSRSFKRAHGMSPSAYREAGRRSGLAPAGPPS